MPRTPSRPRLLFVSNLFPDTREPYRGLDNATILHHLADRWDIGVIALRPLLPWQTRKFEPRTADAAFLPRYLHIPYVPKIGSRVNHRLMARTLREHVRAAEFDVALSSWIYPDSCAVAALSRELRFPLVSIAQGSDVHQYMRHPVRRRVILNALPAASAVITRSAELARLLAEAGIAEAKLHPVYNGIDFNRFTPGDRAAARSSLDLPPDVPVVAFVGNFYAIKNPLVLIEAHGRLARRDALLVMIGGGPLEPEARALAQRLGLAERISFRGRLHADAVALHMQAADALALPSDNEGVPNVILEAFASGLPVVASDVGGIAEVHHGGIFGRLVPPRDAQALASALDEVLAAPPAREDIRQHALQFSWERASAAYHDLLSRAAAHR